MTFTFCDAPQRSLAWFQARLGRLTGTAAADMLAKPSTAGYRDLKMRLVVERLTGAPQDDDYTNAAMEWGRSHEDEARIEYEMHTGQNVRESGFLAAIDLLAGCSLDGHIGDYDGHATFEGILELKCPYKTAIHVETVRAGIPAKYLPQVRHNLWISQAQWCDFVSYDPRVPERLRLSVHRAWAKDLDIPDYEKKAKAFLAECEAEYRALLTITNPAAVMTEALHGV